MQGSLDSSSSAYQQTASHISASDCSNVLVGYCTLHLKMDPFIIKNNSEKPTN